MNPEKYFLSHICEICGQHVGNYGPSHKDCSLEKQKQYAKLIKPHAKGTRYNDKQINGFFKRYDFK